MSGPQVWTAEMAQYQPADTPERVDRLLARYAAYPALLEQNIETLQEGVADGRICQGDLVVATNILLYYDVFEQSLAVANIAAMLRPGGFLLSNDRIFELPGGPVAAAGQTAAAYMNVPGSGPRGDQIYWYQARTAPPLP